MCCQCLPSASVPPDNLSLLIMAGPHCTPPDSLYTFILWPERRGPPEPTASPPLSMSGMVILFQGQSNPSDEVDVVSGARSISEMEISVPFTGRRNHPGMRCHRHTAGCRVLVKIDGLTLPLPTVLRYGEFRHDLGPGTICAGILVSALKLPIGLPARYPLLLSLYVKPVMVSSLFE